MSYDSPEAATQALTDAALPAAELPKIAGAFPQLGATIAAHPNAYPGLLDWLDALGDPAISAAVADRRAVPAPDPSPVVVTPTLVTAPEPVQAAAPTPAEAPIPVLAPEPVQTPAPAPVPTPAQPNAAAQTPAPVPVPDPAPAPTQYWPPVGIPAATALPQYGAPQVAKSDFVGPSSAGAVTGGLLVILCAISQIGLHFAPWSWSSFGVLPGYQTIRFHGGGLFGIISWVSLFTVAAVWLALGIVMMTAGHRRAGGVGVFGFIASVMLVVVPAIELMIAILTSPEGRYVPGFWGLPYAVISPIVFLVAMLFVMLLALTREQTVGFKTVALIALAASIMLSCGSAVNSAMLNGFAHWGIAIGVIEYLTPALLFKLGWLILAATISHRHAPGSGFSSPSAQYSAYQTPYQAMPAGQ